MVSSRLSDSAWKGLLDEEGSGYVLEEPKRGCMIKVNDKAQATLRHTAYHGSTSPDAFTFHDLREADGT